MDITITTRRYQHTIYLASISSRNSAKMANRTDISRIPLNHRHNQDDTSTNAAFEYTETNNNQAQHQQRPETNCVTDFNLRQDLVAEHITSECTVSTYARTTEDGSIVRWTITRPRGNTNPPGDTAEAILLRSQRFIELARERRRLCVEQGLGGEEWDHEIVAEIEDGIEHGLQYGSEDEIERFPYSEAFEHERSQRYREMEEERHRRSQETLSQHLTIIENAINDSMQQKRKEKQSTENQKALDAFRGRFNEKREEKNSNLIEWAVRDPVKKLWYKSIVEGYTARHETGASQSRKSRFSWFSRKREQDESSPIQPYSHGKVSTQSCDSKCPAIQKKGESGKREEKRERSWQIIGKSLLCMCQSEE